MTAKGKDVEEAAYRIEFESHRWHMVEALSQEEALSYLHELGFCGLEIEKALPPSKHVFTHLIWRMEGWLVRVKSLPEGTQTADADTIRSKAFPSALRKYHEIALEILSEEL